ncbi:hypothetical protein [Xylanimonas sp. McL0601]|uniref:hypothetical protein n=1 Tax=Xylanimonas sp. McL0601 TaxID=3414739 RepID=UPI003CF7F390
MTIETAIDPCTTTGVPTYLVRQAIDQAAATGDLLPAEIDRLTERLETRHER